MTLLALFNGFLTADDLWVVSVAAMCGVACAIPGCFLLLRRQSMMGDAISHAVLPGLAVGFLLSGSRSVWPMLGGAGFFGVLTAAASQWLSRLGRTTEDAALGVVFSTLFAVGVVLITQAAAVVDLDPACVLYGVIELTPFDRSEVLGLGVPRAFLVLGVVALVNLALLVGFYKELALSSFDGALAEALGFRPGRIYYGLMAAVAMTCVASFEAAGSILVVALLIAPAAAAHMLTDRLPRLLGIAVGLSIVAAPLGYGAAVALDVSVAGCVAAAACALFALAVLFAPHRGIVSKVLTRWALAVRIHREDELGLRYRALEDASRPPVRPGGTPAARLASWQLRRRGFVANDLLTPSGRAEAERVVRSHRLWERFLSSGIGLPLDHLHEPSERMEHYIDASVMRELEAQFGGGSDPHGRTIPGSTREQ